MALENITDKLIMKNRALYYLVLFASFALVIHFSDKLMLFITGKLGGVIPYALANTIIGYFILYSLALYILPMLLAYLIIMLIDRR